MVAARQEIVYVYAGGAATSLDLYRPYLLTYSYYLEYYTQRTSMQSSSGSVIRSPRLWPSHCRRRLLPEAWLGLGLGLGLGS